MAFFFGFFQDGFSSTSFNQPVGRREQYLGSKVIRRMLTTHLLSQV
jgi:hypothetical protein